MKNRVKQIAMMGLLVVFLSVIAAPVLGAPITGKTGDKLVREAHKDLMGDSP
jgi:hypothetical protein